MGPEFSCETKIRRVHFVSVADAQNVADEPQQIHAVIKDKGNKTHAYQRSMEGESLPRGGARARDRIVMEGRGTDAAVTGWESDDDE